MITKEEFEEWLQMDVTKEIKKSLRNQIEEVAIGLINDSYDDERIAKGMARAYQNIIDLTYEDLYHE